MLTRRKFLEILSFLAGAAVIGWTPPAGLAANRKPDEFDAVIIGSGLGGLGCAALMAKSGLRALVIEKHTVSGGYATSFQRTDAAGNDFTCEVSLHSAVARSPGARRLLAEMGVYDSLLFVNHKLGWCRVDTGGVVDLPIRGLRGFEAVLAERFPAEDAAIARFMAYWRQFVAEMRRLERRGGGNMTRFPSAFPALWFAAGKTLDEVLSRYIANPALKNFIGMAWSYYGLPPSELSAFYYLEPMAEYLTYGGQYLRGTSQSLSNALAKVVTDAGGGVLLGERVTEIILHDGRAAGVRTDTGETFLGRAVVSNAAAPSLPAMLPAGTLPENYAKRLAQCEPSLGSFIVWLGLKRDIRDLQPRAAFSIAPEGDPETAYAAARRGEWSKVGLGCMIYDNLVSGFSPAGKTTMSITCLSGFDPWKRFERDYLAGRKAAYRTEKNRIAALLVARAQRMVPDLSDIIVMRETASPLTNRRFTANPAGAIYGYAQTPNNSFLSRIANRTPVKGLYLASAWGTPGGGYGGVLAGAKNAFKSIVKDWRSA